MSEHTPGPWTPHFHERNRRTLIGDWVFTAKDGHPVRLGGTVECNVRARANANLVAAAPDMLKALKAIHYYETIRDPNRGELFLGALRQVEDAIAKAEGKS